MVSTLLSETIQWGLHNARIAGRTHNLFYTPPTVYQYYYFIADIAAIYYEDK